MASRLEIELLFSSVHPLPRVLSPSEIAASQLFQESANPGPFHELDVELHEAVVPRFLRPTNVFHQALAKRLADSGVPLSKQQPFDVTLSTGDRARLTLRLRLMPPNVLCITACLRGISVDAANFADPLIELQLLDRQPAVLRAISSAVGLVEKLDRTADAESRPKRIVPAVGVQVDVTSGARTWAENHTRELVGVLIRDVDYEQMANSLIDAVIGKNANLNLKTAQELVLFDKQGLLYVSSDLQRDRRFRRLATLQEVALAYAAFLASYRTDRSSAPELYDFVLSKVARWVDKPDPVFRSSVSNRYAWGLIRDELQLGEDLAEITAGGGVVARLSESRDLFETLGRRWWELPNFSEILSEALRERREDARFSYVADKKLRVIIASDLHEAEVALQARAYKASMILSGSVAEAMLLAAVLDSPHNSEPESKLQKEGLHELADRAKKLGLVKDQNTLDLVDRWLRRYRNLIHPGRQRREDHAPDENKATIALRAVKDLAGQLS